MTLKIEKFGQKQVAKTQKAWKPVLEQWASLMDSYINTIEGDPAPFAYTERANVGLLSGAILRAHEENLTLEEYTATKDTSKGRADLWAVVGDSTYLVEAKHGWSSCQNGLPYFRSVKASMEGRNLPVRDLLDAAMDQAEGYEDERPEFHVAALFVVPYITEKRTTSFDDVWDKILKEDLQPGTHSGFVAYYKQDEVVVDPEEDFQRYPGVILFLSFLKRRKLR